MQHATAPPQRQRRLRDRIRTARRLQDASSVETLEAAFDLIGFTRDLNQVAG